MGDKKVSVVEVREPEAMLAALLNVIAGYEFQDGVGQWISEESDVREESLDSESRRVWDLYKQIKEQL